MKSTASVATVVALVLTLALITSGCITAGDSLIPVETSEPQRGSVTATTSTSTVLYRSPETPPGQISSDSTGYQAGYDAGLRDCSKASSTDGINSYNAGYEAGFEDGMKSAQESMEPGLGF